MSRVRTIDVSAQVDGSSIRYQVRPSRPVAEYFTAEEMFVTYDRDLAQVPEAILVIPGLATLAPIAWILGAELRTRVVDELFLESLGRVRRAFQGLYPLIEWAGDVQPASTVAGDIDWSDGREGLLFSGGVDSLASYVRRRHLRPRLVSVWGADVGLGRPREWRQVVATIQDFARYRSLEVSFVKTNFRTFFNHFRLRDRFFRDFPNWYSAVQQGLGLVGLCAPLSSVHGLGRIGIPATYSGETEMPWGSHPTIDGELRWAATEVVHDGYDLSRQMKLALLADYIREEDPRLLLRVCWGRGANCGSCAKCRLTMIGLALEGVDPNHHGFRLDRRVLSRIRAQLQDGSMPLTEFRHQLWAEIQRKVAVRKRLDIDGLDEFCDWLAGASMQECQSRSDARARLPHAVLARYVETRPEPVGRLLRKWRGHPFP